MGGEAGGWAQGRHTQDRGSWKEQGAVLRGLWREHSAQAPRCHTSGMTSVCCLSLRLRVIRFASLATPTHGSPRQTEPMARRPDCVVGRINTFPKASLSNYIQFPPFM